MNEEKTRICKVPEGEFDFLGYTFGQMFSARTGQARIGYRPSKKSMPLSLFSRKVEIALRDKSITFEREMVPFTQAHGYEPRHPVVLAVNPKRQVPVLIDGDLALFDLTLDLRVPGRPPPIGGIPSR